MIPILSLITVLAAAAMHAWIWKRERRLRKEMLARENPPEATVFFLPLFVSHDWLLGSPSWLPGAALLFLVARAAQAIGTDRRRPNALRIGGAVLCWLLVLALGLLVLRPLI